MRKTKEEAAVTRNTLLDAALVVFSKQGYESTRLEDIADEAGVTRGAIYHHFGGKVELYNALLEERFARANQVWQDAIAEGGTPLQMLRRLMVRSLQYLEEDADYRAVQEMVSFKTAMIPELEDGLQKKKAGQQAYLDYLAGLVEQGVDAGEIRPGTNPRDAAIAIIGMMNGVGLLWMFDTKLFSLRARAENIVDTFLNGIAM
jgi:TetR/AcrR family transcriptional regulator, acrAB operon repressor